MNSNEIDKTESEQETSLQTNIRATHFSGPEMFTLPDSVRGTYIMLMAGITVRADFVYNKYSRKEYADKEHKYATYSLLSLIDNENKIKSEAYERVTKAAMENMYRIILENNLLDKLSEKLRQDELYYKEPESDIVISEPYEQQ